MPGRNGWTPLDSALSRWPPGLACANPTRSDHTGVSTSVTGLF